MIIPMSHTHLGYDFLDKVNSYQIHSGVDLNYGRPYDDLGKPVKAMANGEVVFAKNMGKGWGKLIVLYHPAYGVWSRYAHLDSFDIIHGAKVKEGQQIGTCGATGGDWKPHLHWDIISQELPKWTSYTSFWSMAKVKDYYEDPLKYVAKVNEEENKEPTDAICKWHIKNKMITKWNNPPTPEEIKLGWVSYKIMKSIKTGKIDKITFNL